MTVIVKGEHLLRNCYMCCVCSEWNSLQGVHLVKSIIAQSSVEHWKGLLCNENLSNFNIPSIPYWFHITTRANYKDYFPCLYNQKLIIFTFIWFSQNENNYLSCPFQTQLYYCSIYLSWIRKIGIDPFYKNMGSESRTSATATAQPTRIFWKLMGILWLPWICPE